MQNKLQVKYTNIQPSLAISDYIVKKLVKHEPESRGLFSIICRIAKETERRGRTYTVTLEVELNRAGFIVKERGNDLYQLIDTISDKFRKRITKHASKQVHSADTSVKNPAEAVLPLTVNEDAAQYNRMPDLPDVTGISIVERRRYFDNSPLHLEEAIEILEITGKHVLLFRNISTGKYSVIYRVAEEGVQRGYGLLEPHD